jgi:hypothetical protein
MKQPMAIRSNSPITELPTLSAVTGPVTTIKTVAMKLALEIRRQSGSRRNAIPQVLNLAGSHRPDLDRHHNPQPTSRRRQTTPTSKVGTPTDTLPLTRKDAQP